VVDTPTAEVTLSGDRRVVGAPFELSAEGSSTHFVQQEDASPSNWTYVVLTDREPYYDVVAAIASVWK
jgi:hypothetical protein